VNSSTISSIADYDGELQIGTDADPTFYLQQGGNELHNIARSGNLTNGVFSIGMDSINGFIPTNNYAEFQIQDGHKNLGAQFPHLSDVERSYFPVPGGAGPRNGTMTTDSITGELVVLTTPTNTWLRSYEKQHLVIPVTTGNTYMMAAGYYNILTGSGLTAITLNIPAGGHDGQELEIKITATIVSLTWTGATVANAFSSATAGQYIKLVWDQTTATYY